jgi:hypothetical protein
VHHLKKRYTQEGRCPAALPALLRCKFFAQCVLISPGNRLLLGRG